MYSSPISRSKPPQSQYTLQGPGPRSLSHLSISPVAGPSTHRDSCRQNNSIEEYTSEQTGNTHDVVSYINSRQYSSANLPDEAVPVSYQQQTQPQYSHVHDSATYLAQGYNSRTYDVTDVNGPSLSARYGNPTPLNTSFSFPSASSRGSSAITPSSPEYTSDVWPPAVKDVLPTNYPKRKPRREKPKIALAPGQPPTTQGKPRARVFVACLQCRNRKIRCDGAKPVCHNCSRRSGSKECNYDPVPRRRGPDRVPGARQRMARELKEALDNDPLASSRRRRRRRDTSSFDISHRTRGVNSNLTGRRSRSRSLLSPLTGSLSPVSSSDLTNSPSTYRHPSGPLPCSVATPVRGECPCHGLSQCPGSVIPSYSAAKSLAELAAMPRQYNPVHALSTVLVEGVVPEAHIETVDDDYQESEIVRDVTRQPSLSFTKKVWYDSLCSLYVSIDSKHLRQLSNDEREQVSQVITSDLRFLFRVSNYWFSFFHIPSFFGSYFDPVKRERMQPSLVLSVLALSTFWQSSDVGRGRDGRHRALRFRDEAQSALEASLNTGWIDETLAQSAWLLALFEVCAHPEHSTERTFSSMVMLDNIIRSLSLTIVDANDPQASVFPSGDVPAVSGSSQKQWSSAWPVPSFHVEPKISQHTSLTGSSNSCNCHSLTLGAHWPSSLQHTPMWATTPTWNPSWSEAEIRRESIRRLCWSTMALSAGRLSYYAVHRFQEPELFISDPANFQLLFSGESIVRSPSLYSSKDTIWALHDRAFLLWHICVKMRHNLFTSDTEKAQFALKAWLEADTIEAALNKHTCAIEKAYIFQGREYLFNIRMCISYEFQRYIPLVSSDSLFHRGKAEEWLIHQATVAQRFMHGLHTITGNSNNLLAHRPFFVFWFMSQVARAISLYESDNSLVVALDVCKAFLPAINYLSALWPCHAQRHRYERLRERLNAACYTAGVSLPPPPDFTLPDPSSPQSLV